jgi:hypothetical protein
VRSAVVTDGASGIGRAVALPGMPSSLGHPWRRHRLRHKRSRRAFPSLPGIAISGPAAITSPFTTVILGPDEVANVTATGDILIELPATARA